MYLVLFDAAADQPQTIIDAQCRQAKRINALGRQGSSTRLFGDTSSLMAESTAAAAPAEEVIVDRFTHAVIAIILLAYTQDRCVMCAHNKY
jgi:hypothetical protein